MDYRHPRFGQSQTPKSLKILIIATITVSLLSALCENLLPHFFGLLPPEKILGLSAWGIEHYFYWQFFTYLFVSPAPHGISFFLLISLAFNAYLLWILGNSIFLRKGAFHFFCLYFFSGIISAGAVYGIQAMTHSPAVFSGNWTALYAVLIGWTMLHPQAELLLFLVMPIKAKWIAVTLLGANILIDLSTGSILSALAYLIAAIIGYFYCILAWKTLGPFPSLHRFEGLLISLTARGPEGFTNESFHPKAKIYDFKTGKAILSDEEFMDAMLTKISLKGKSSLTWTERFRLRRIVKRKQKKH